MKKLTIFLMLLVGVLLTTTLTSCEKDETYTYEEYTFPPEYKEFFEPKSVLPTEDFLNSKWTYNRTWEPGNETTKGYWHAGQGPMEQNISFSNTLDEYGRISLHINNGSKEHFDEWDEICEWENGYNDLTRWYYYTGRIKCEFYLVNPDRLLVIYNGSAYLTQEFKRIK